VCYLAAGKPVVTQETGFSTYVPTGRGLFAFDKAEEAAAALEEINRDYALHCRAAHEVAVASFDSDKVLGELCLEAGL
jgi:glycosyltransferase involved in cell wall biosynthesis